jgi:hypothetical protein
VQDGLFPQKLVCHWSGIFAEDTQKLNTLTLRPVSERFTTAEAFLASAFRKLLKFSDFLFMLNAFLQLAKVVDRGCSLSFLLSSSGLVLLLSFCQFQSAIASTK